MHLRLSQVGDNGDFSLGAEGRWPSGTGPVERAAKSRYSVAGTVEHASGTFVEMQRLEGLGWQSYHFIQLSGG